jgi:hypothetical protein
VRGVTVCCGCAEIVRMLYQEVATVSWPHTCLAYCCSILLMEKARCMCIILGVVRFFHVVYNHPGLQVPFVCFEYWPTLCSYSNYQRLKQNISWARFKESVRDALTYASFMSKCCSRTDVYNYYGLPQLIMQTHM